jgi:hypothetical protein
MVKRFVSFFIYSLVGVVLSVRSLSIDADTGVDTGVTGAAATGEVTYETELPMGWRTTRESVEPSVLPSDVPSVLPSDEKPSYHRRRNRCFFLHISVFVIDSNTSMSTTGC